MNGSTTIKFCIKSCLIALPLTVMTGAQALDVNVNALDAHQDETNIRHDDNDPALRDIAAQRVHWLRPGPVANPESWLKVKILGINDFHGQLSAGRTVGPRPVGGAAVLASYLHDAQRGVDDRAVIVHAGDHVGASPPASALLQDEPSISFLNLLGNDDCTFKDVLEPRCNVVGTLGNHEFDEGVDEMQRLLRGGNHATGP